MKRFSDRIRRRDAELSDMPVITIPGIKIKKTPSQCKRPTGWVGRLVLWSMNRRHSKLTDWGLRQISTQEGDTILDVGCGGGRTVNKLAAAANLGVVYGIDYAEESVAAARRVNEQLMKQGRVEIRQ